MPTLATIFDPFESLRNLLVPTVSLGGFRRCAHLAMAGACVLLLTSTPPASAQTPDVRDQPAANGEIDAVEQEVLNNILQQPIGNTTLESLDLPPSFLRRVAGRIIRSSYQHRYHVVVEGTLPSSDGNDGSRGPANNHSSSDGPSTKMNREQALPKPPKLFHYYLIGLGILIAAAAGALVLRRSRRARR